MFSGVCHYDKRNSLHILQDSALILSWIPDTRYEEADRLKMVKGVGCSLCLPETGG